MSAVVADTPYYVLMDGNHRIGPQVEQFPAGIECSSIYGFSGKAAYEKFCRNHQRVLKPYPLVKGYLRNQDGEAGDGPKLVVIDAAGPRETYLQAASMVAVLEAQEKKTTHVTAAFRLMFDQKANAYRVEEDRHGNRLT